MVPFQIELSGWTTSWRVDRLVKIALLVIAAGAVYLSTGCKPLPPSLASRANGWGPMPIIVHLEEEPGFDWHDELKWAMDQWNDALGCVVFYPGKHYGDVTVRHGGASEKGYLGAAGKSVVSRRKRGVIYLYNLATIDVVLNVLRHELGHILGLKDERTGSRRSIMFHKFYRSELSSTRWIQKHHVEQLRPIYCPKADEVAR